MQPRTSLRRKRLAITLLAAWVVAACGGTGPTGMPPASGQPGGGQSTSPNASVAPGGPVASVDLGAGFTPVDAAVTLDATHAAEALVPLTGGTVKATAADGTTYTLEIPADALTAETTVVLTPATSVAGLPFGTAPAYAVQMSPDGLQLLNYATLTIVPAQPIAAKDQVAFGYRGAGTDVIAAAPVLDSPEVKIRVLHFSGAGVTTGAAAQVSLGADASSRIESSINQLLQDERARQLNNEEADPSVIQRVGQLLDQYEREVIQPRVAAAGADCEAGKKTLEMVVTLERSRELLGLANPDGTFMSAYGDLLNKVIRKCVLEEFESCVQHHQFAYMLTLYFTVLRQHQLLPLLTPGTLEEVRDLTIKCLTFKLVLNSTAKLNQAGFNHSSTVTAELFLRLNPEKLLINGSGAYINTEYQAGGIPDCTVTTMTGDGTMAVLGLVWVFELGAKDSTGNYPNAGITDYELTYAVNNSGEQMSIHCPRSFATPMSPYPIWSLCFYDARVDLLNPDAGLKAKNWELESPGDELLATKDWDLVGVADPNCREKGSFELHHSPGS